MKLAVDMFLKLDGIDGEAKDRMHGKEIEVLAWSWGATRSGTTPMGAGGGGKACIHDLYFTKYIDSATHSLMQKIFSGDRICTGALVVRPAGAKALDYLILTMTNISVKSLSTGGSTGDDRLTENVALSFSKVNLEYVPLKQGGVGSAAMTVGWDIAANRSTAESMGL